MKTKTMQLWAARDRGGRLLLHKEEPQLNDDGLFEFFDYSWGYMEVNKKMLPELKEEQKAKVEMSLTLIEERSICQDVCPNKFTEAVEAYCDNCEFNKQNRTMLLNEYQEKAMTTCMDSSDNISYMALNLVGEVGEFTGKLAKMIRKGIISIDGNHFNFSPSVTDEEEVEILDGIKKELGDIAWQLSGCCFQFGFSLDEVCEDNLSKLQSRKQRNVIDGSGDYR